MTKITTAIDKRYIMDLFTSHFMLNLQINEKFSPLLLDFFVVDNLSVLGQADAKLFYEM